MACGETRLWIRPLPPAGKGQKGNAEFSTYSDKVVGEEPPPTVQLSLPPAALILPDVTDDVTDSDGQLVIVLGLVIKLHNGFHWEREENKQSDLEVMVTCRKQDVQY